MGRDSLLANRDTSPSGKGETGEGRGQEGLLEEMVVGGENGLGFGQEGDGHRGREEDGGRKKSGFADKNPVGGHQKEDGEKRHGGASGNLDGPGDGKGG